MAHPQSPFPFGQVISARRRRRMSRRLTAVLAGLLVAAVAAVGATAKPALDPGITAKTIKLGGTYPLSGPAASYAPIPKGTQVYFSYINARRGAEHKRGVGGRQ